MSMKTTISATNPSDHNRPTSVLRNPLSVKVDGIENVKRTMSGRHGKTGRHQGLHFRLTQDVANRLCPVMGVHRGRLRQVRA